MATFVETKSVRILMDHSVALAYRRYGIEPHPLELKRLDECWRRVKSYAEIADILVVTHYHYDHHSSWYQEIYRDKTLLLKDPSLNINRSQMRRAALFLQAIGGVAKLVKPADGRVFNIGDATIRFSKAVSHGADTRLGYILGVGIKSGGEGLLFTSDVQGPVSDEQTGFILAESPQA